MHGMEIRLFLFLSFAPLLSFKEGALIRIVQLYVVNTSYLSGVLFVRVDFVCVFFCLPGWLSSAIESACCLFCNQHTSILE